jgi:hypothetical protein
MNGVRWLTYDDMAETLGIRCESARVLTQRKRWPRRAGNDGKARVGVPEEEITARSDAPNDARNDAPISEVIELRVLAAHLEARIEALQAIAAAERERDERERQTERELAERERQLLERTIVEITAQRDRWAAQAERLACTPLQPERRGWWPFCRRA